MKVYFLCMQNLVHISHPVFIFSLGIWKSHDFPGHMYKRREREKFIITILDDPGQKVIVEKTGCQNQQFQTEKKSIIVKIRQS